MALLAGCADDSGGGRKGFELADGTRPDLDVEPTKSGLGAIAGVVVDEAIRPVIGANITNADKGTTKTDEGGIFVLNDLEPGLYVLHIVAAGFLPIQTSAEVTADATTEVRVQLLVDNSPIPFPQTIAHDGHMQAWGGIAQFFVEATLENGSAACNCRLWFQPTETPTDVIYEAFWKDSVPDPAEQAEFYYVIEEPSGSGDVSDYCFSPCYVRFEYAAAGFTVGTRAYARLDGPDTWPEAQQSFKLYVTLWYNGPAPEGWTIAAA